MENNRGSAESKIRIGMVLLEPFPEDIRIEKEAVALDAASYSVHLLCLGRSGEPYEETVGCIIVRRVFPPSVFARKIDSANFSLTMFRPFWRKCIEKFVRDYSLKSLHVHDLPLCKTALKVSSDKRIPLIADLHEHYPYALQMWKERTPLLDVLKSPFKGLKRWLRYEKSISEHADAVIVSCDEFKARVIRDGSSGDNINVVRNTIDLDGFEAPDSAFAEKYKNRFVIIYLGVLSLDKGISIVIDALPEIVHEVPPALFLVVGAGFERDIRAIEDSAKKLGVADNIEICGRVPHASIFGVLSAGHVAVLHLRADNINYNASSPHKLFEYMAAGLPVIVSPSESTANIVKQTGCGVVVGFDPSDFAMAVIELAKNPEKRITMGEKGKKAVADDFNWATDAERLVALYDKLHKRGQSVSGQ